MSNRISFHGAARTVTGSKHLIESNGRKVLVDCGLFQGSRELSDRNWDPWPFNPHEIDALVLTHAHGDHLAMIPRLVRDGFTGPIYATAATIGIAKFSLPDSARIQEEDARYHAKHGTSRHADPRPLYTEEDAKAALRLFRPIPYGETTSLPGKMSFEFRVAGHIFGSAFAHITFSDGTTLLMGGDLGPYDAPLIRDPDTIEETDYLVLESTYGDRVHPEEDTEAVLEEIFQNAYSNSQTVIIPSFAIGRTQELLYYISRLQVKGTMPRIPIFLDSPMAVTATQLYDRSVEEYDDEMKAMVEAGDHPLEPDYLTFVRDANQSKELNSRRGPMIIIAGSGMANGGRVVHHLKHRLPHQDTLVLFVGYQGSGTLGRQILDGATEVEIHRVPVEVRAEIKRITSLSAHADQDDIMRWLGGFTKPPKHTFIVHGEPQAQDVLAAKLRAELGWEVSIPEQGDSATLN
ncbi:MAG: MBL fold metallo-hydrolase [Chthonomonas sp.]|nr:MBL fold metallo-hydrolase [Chthonomonas sp.]